MPIYTSNNGVSKELSHIWTPVGGGGRRNYFPFMER